MSEFETIDFEMDRTVAVVTLNRPDTYNAVNKVMNRELIAMLKSVRKLGARALVLTGAGKAFCSGQDLKDVGGDADWRVDEHVRTLYNPIAIGFRESPIPVIAAVNGIAAGAGASLALACDLRICSDRASFMQAFIRIGLVPDTGSTWFLPHLVGTARALELAWSGEGVGAERAVAIGMANRVVPHDELMPATLQLAQHLASQPTRTIGMIKRAVYRAETSTLESALEYEAQLQHVAIQTEDHSEGIAAFLEKRDPVFSGR